MTSGLVGDRNEDNLWRRIYTIRREEHEHKLVGFGTIYIDAGIRNDVGA